MYCNQNHFPHHRHTTGIPPQGNLLASSDLLKAPTDNFSKLCLVSTGFSTGCSAHLVSLNFSSFRFRSSARRLARLDFPGGDNPKPDLGQLDSLIMSVNECFSFFGLFFESIRLYVCTSVLISENGSKWLSVLAELQYRKAILKPTTSLQIQC